MKTWKKTSARNLSKAGGNPPFIIMKRYGWKINSRTDRMNGEKGFYMYETKGVTNENETFSLALLEGHFEDNKD